MFNFRVVALVLDFLIFSEQSEYRMYKSLS